MKTEGLRFLWASPQTPLRGRGLQRPLNPQAALQTSCFFLLQELAALEFFTDYINFHNFHHCIPSNVYSEP